MFEAFSILSIWAGERRAVGHAPRGIHLSLRSMLSAVATGDRGNVRDFSFFFRNSQQQRSAVYNGRHAILFLFFCFFVFFFVQTLSLQKNDIHPVSVGCLLEKHACAPLCWNSIYHWHYGATTFQCGLHKSRCSYN